IRYFHVTGVQTCALPIYHQGIGVEPDYERANQLYALAAQQGITSAQINLGLMYDRGEGVAQSYTEAYYWYEQAAEAGNPDGQYRSEERRVGEQCESTW